MKTLTCDGTGSLAQEEEKTLVKFENNRGQLLDSGETLLSKLAASEKRRKMCNKPEVNKHASRLPKTLDENWERTCGAGGALAVGASWCWW